MKAKHQDFCRQHLQYLDAMVVHLTEIAQQWSGLNSVFERHLRDLVEQAQVLGDALATVLPDADGQEGQP